jgi:hypothetical protein
MKQNRSCGIYRKKSRRAGMFKDASFKATLISGAVAILALGATVTPSQAENGRNAAAIAGAVGGFAAGAAVGAAGRHDPYYTGSVRQRRVIVEDDGEDCVVRTKRVYVNGVMKVRRQEVCH